MPSNSDLVDQVILQRDHQLPRLMPRLNAAEVFLHGDHLDVLKQGVLLIQVHATHSTLNQTWSCTSGSICGKSDNSDYVVTESLCANLAHKEHAPTNIRTNRAEDDLNCHTVSTVKQASQGK